MTERVNTKLNPGPGQGATVVTGAAQQANSSGSDLKADRNKHNAGSRTPGGKKILKKEDEKGGSVSVDIEYWEDDTQTVVGRVQGQDPQIVTTAQQRANTTLTTEPSTTTSHHMLPSPPPAIARAAKITDVAKAAIAKAFATSVGISQASGAGLYPLNTGVWTSGSNHAGVGEGTYNEFAERPKLATETIVTMVPGVSLANWDMLNRIKDSAGGLDKGTQAGLKDGLFGAQDGALSLFPDKSTGIAVNPLAPEDTASNYHDQAEEMGSAWDSIGAAGYRPGTSLAVLKQFSSGAKQQGTTGGKHGRLIGVIGSGSGTRSGHASDQRVMGPDEEGATTPAPEPQGTDTDDTPIVLRGPGTRTRINPNGTTSTTTADGEGSRTITDFPGGGFMIEVSGGNGRGTVWARFDSSGRLVQVGDRGGPVRTYRPGETQPQCKPGMGCDDDLGNVAGIGGSRMADRRQRALISAITRERTGQPGHDDQHSGAGSSGQGTPWEEARRGGGGSGNSLGNGLGEHCRVAYCSETGISGGLAGNSGQNPFRMLDWQVNPGRPGE